MNAPAAKVRKLTPAEELSLGVKIASDIHHGQYDAGENPYILHPLFLMNQFLYDLQLAAIAVMHDVIEDSKGQITISYLRAIGFSDRVCDALDLLTHVRDRDYVKKYGKTAEYLEVYIPAICTNLDSTLIKRKDNDHNSRITRLKLEEVDGCPVLTQKVLDRLEKYARSYILLGAAKRKMQQRVSGTIQYNTRG